MVGKKRGYERVPLEINLDIIARQPFDPKGIDSLLTRYYLRAIPSSLEWRFLSYLVATSASTTVRIHPIPADCAGLAP